MFVVKSQPTFKHTVKVSVPVDGGFKDETCEATFRVIADDEINQLNLAQAADSSAFLDRAIISLDDLVDDNKQAIAWNDEVRAELLKLPYLRRALARTYFEAIQGVRVKN